jgi:hypothetical protein
MGTHNLPQNYARIINKIVYRIHELDLELQEAQQKFRLLIYLETLVIKWLSLCCAVTLLGPGEELCFSGEYSARLILCDDSNIREWVNYW